MADDVTEEEKVDRRVRLEKLQESILAETNAALLGREEEILVEGRHKGKWQGRTRSNKLVYFQHEADQLGRLVKVEIIKTTPWSLQGTLAA